MCILRLTAKAPCLRGQLTSNVRPGSGSMCVPQAVANSNAMLGSRRTHDLKLSCSAETATSAQPPMPEMQILRRHVRTQLPRLLGTAPATSVNMDATAPAPTLSATKDQRVSLCRVVRSKVDQMQSSKS